MAVDVRRGERTLSVRVPVVERESETGQLEALIGTQQATRTLGVIALDLTAPIAAMLPPVRRGAGAVVARVTPEAPYSHQGRLQPGDVIYALNGKPIANVEDLKNAAAALKPSAAAVLLIERHSTLMYLAFRVER